MKKIIFILLFHLLSHLVMYTKMLFDGAQKGIIEKEEQHNFVMDSGKTPDTKEIKGEKV